MRTTPGGCSATFAGRMTGSPQTARPLAACVSGPPTCFAKTICAPASSYAPRSTRWSCHPRIAQPTGENAPFLSVWRAQQHLEVDGRFDLRRGEADREEQHRSARVPSRESVTTLSEGRRMRRRMPSISREGCAPDGSGWTRRIAAAAPAPRARHTTASSSPTATRMRARRPAIPAGSLGRTDRPDKGGRRLGTGSAAPLPHSRDAEQRRRPTAHTSALSADTRRGDPSAWSCGPRAVRGCRRRPRSAVARFAAVHYAGMVGTRLRLALLAPVLNRRLRATPATTSSSPPPPTPGARPRRAVAAHRGARRLRLRPRRHDHVRRRPRTADASSAPRAPARLHRRHRARTVRMSWRVALQPDRENRYRYRYRNCAATSPATA